MRSSRTSVTMDDDFSSSSSSDYDDLVPSAPLSGGIWVDDDIPEEELIMSMQYQKKQKRSQRRRWASFLAVVALAGASYQVGFTFSRKPLEARLEQAEAERQQLLDNQQRLLEEKATLSRYPRENEKLAEKLEELTKELEIKSDLILQNDQRRLMEEYDLLSILDQKQQVAVVDKERENSIINFMRTLAYDKFGTGVQEVEFEVRVWDEDDYEDMSFVVEVAPFETMPVSAYFFLEQVDRGIWDGTSFHLNSPTTVVAQPVSGNHRISKLPEMEAFGLARVPVNEASDYFSHQEYTLGFGSSKETAGSFFFINKQDNSRQHANQAAFAKVVSGFDAIDRIASLETDSHYQIQPVDIISARIL